MRSIEEKLLLLHSRAEKLERQREKRLLSLTGGLTAVSALILIVCVMNFGNLSHSLQETSLSGASLLNENVGAYVIVAIAAAVAASILTGFCLRRHDRLIEKKREGKGNE